MLISDPGHKQSLGIIGGAGPVASAKFLLSIYQGRVPAFEQEMLSVTLLSDPSLPDRSEAISNKTVRDRLLQETSSRLDFLVAAGASHLLICCFSLHFLIPSLPDPIVRKLISLPHIALREAAVVKGPLLLLCSTACRELGVFQSDPLWPQVEDKIIWPSPVDQARVHDLIYALKRNDPPGDVQAQLLEISANYSASHWLAGCTELHLLSSIHWMGTASGPLVIDALETLANATDLDTFVSRTAQSNR